MLRKMAIGTACPSNRSLRSGADAKRRGVRTSAKLPDVSSTLSIISGVSGAASQSVPSDVTELAGDVVGLVEAGQSASTAAKAREHAETLEAKGQSTVARRLKSQTDEVLGETLANATTIVADSVRVVAELPPAHDILGPLAHPIGSTAGMTASSVGLIVAGTNTVKAIAALRGELPARRSDLEVLARDALARPGLHPGEEKLIRRFLALEGERLSKLELYLTVELVKNVASLGGSALGAAGVVAPLLSLHVGLHLGTACVPLGTAAVPLAVVSGVLGFASRGTVRDTQKEVIVPAERTLERLVGASPGADAPLARAIASYLGAAPAELRDETTRRTRLDLHLGPFARSRYLRDRARSGR